MRWTYQELLSIPPEVYDVLVEVVTQALAQSADPPELTD
jgi:hypothetical protein